jgi:hypothetical protein
MSEPKPMVERFKRSHVNQLDDIDFRIRQQADLCAGFTEPHMHGLWGLDDVEDALTEFRALVPRRLPKPVAE